MTAKGVITVAALALAVMYVNNTMRLDTMLLPAAV